MRTSIQFGVSIIRGGRLVLEMKVGVLVEPVSCLHKQVAIEVNATQHQGVTRIREIQCQVKMYSYTSTLSGMHVIVMDILPINALIKKRKQLILQLLELC